MVDVATRVAARHCSDVVSSENDIPVPLLPRSFSFPLVGYNQSPTPACVHRSKSAVDLGEDVDTAPDPKSYPILPIQLWPEPKEGQDCGTAFEKTGSLVLPNEAKGDQGDNSKHEEAGSDDGPHLHTMAISEQLRSMSQLSNTAEESTRVTPNPLWAFHRRERSAAGAPNPLSRQYSRKTSGATTARLTVSTPVERVRSPPCDAASSIYSRPTSAGASTPDGNIKRPDSCPYEIPNDLNALFADWPLKHAMPSEVTGWAFTTQSPGRSGAPRRITPFPLIPLGTRKDSGTSSTVKMNRIATQQDSTAGATAAHELCSVHSKSSSSTLTKLSKRSRFLERFSPPKRAVRKRRSIFKFLRPGRDHSRSISSPMLSYKPLAGGLDGPSDDPSLLTVQYELTEYPGRNQRSASVNELGPTNTGNLATSQGPQRQPTFAEYERNLTVSGDDRRRPSVVNLLEATPSQGDDVKESGGIRRRLSRAKELKDDANPLMANALQKHQQEKALFQSASKLRENSLAEEADRPSVGVARQSRAGSSLEPNLQDQSGALDPLETASPTALDVGKASASNLQTAAVGSVNKRGEPSVIHRVSTGQPKPSKLSHGRIGTSLSSWSRYPIHTRVERCGSAGRTDRILVHDFAVEMSPDEMGALDESEAGSTTARNAPDLNPGKTRGRHAKTLSKSRSLTFGGIVRYYSNLFHTAGFAGQNRRTSVTTGGRLEYPELEMLPPSVSSDHPHGHSEHMNHLKEIVREDVEKIRDFAQDESELVKGTEKRLGEYVKKEEGKVKVFVSHEEAKIKKHHHQHHPEHHRHHREHSSDHDANAVPFRHGSIFAADPHAQHPHQARRNTLLVSPDEDKDGPPGSLHLDGVAESVAETTQTTSQPPASKAEAWSHVYREYVAPHGPSDPPRQSQSMPPPRLRPGKPRSPAQPTPMDQAATIRRFPSVTVVDDRKGHLRSVSLISVSKGRSAGLERPSTQDLLDLIQLREREEREKLLAGVVV